VPALPQQARNGQLVDAAGSAIVSAARVGRLLGRTGWRIARQLPGMSAVEQQAQRLREAAAAELLRLLEVPQQLFGTGSFEDQRVMMLVRNAATDPAPLRTAMNELLTRSVQSSRTSSREYLFGTIVSQLVPDEARVLAALADHPPFAALDVLAKQGRRAERAVLANASTVGGAAGIALPRNTPTYLSRLHGLGLVEFGPANDALADDYTRLADDEAVRDARRRIETGRLGSVRLARKTVTLSALGREFWAACAPSGR
jgi:Abortive infection alpha